MIKKIAITFVNFYYFFLDFIKKNKVIWFIFTIRGLKYKFRALRLGINNNESYFNLRRNIHRIEKGLSYENSKPVFALDYIEETIELLLGQQKFNSSFDTETETWSISVINKYFKKVDHSNKTIKKSIKRYGEVTQIKEKEYIFFPYDASKRKKSTIEYNELLDLALQRRSIRFFKSTPIEKQVISKIFEIAKLSPSACNRQSFKYLFYNDAEVVKKISAIPGGIAGYKLSNIIVVLGDYKGYFNIRDVNTPIIDASLSVMSFLFACETLGIGTVCVNWPNLSDKEKKLRTVIQIEDTQFVVMLIGLGYPAETGKIPYSAKRGNNNFLAINSGILQ